MSNIVRGSSAELQEFSADQVQILRDSFANGANEQEFAVLLEIARARRLNPILRQIYFVQRWNGERGRMVWEAQVSIDGLRAQAQRTGLYDGQDEPEFETAESGLPALARVRVYRKDWSRPAVGVARWEEYAQTKKDGSLTRAWSSMPFVMLGKCAEALAIRKAFPEDTSGLYTPEEMSRAGDSVDALQRLIDSADSTDELEAAAAAIRAHGTLAPNARRALADAFKRKRSALIALEMAKLTSEADESTNNESEVSNG